MIAALIEPMANSFSGMLYSVSWTLDSKWSASDGDLFACAWSFEAEYLTSCIIDGHF